MPLSEDEKSRLDEIEAHIRASDPDFVRRLHVAHRPTVAPAANPTRGYRRTLIVLNCLLFVSASLFANGLSAARGLISLGTVAALVGGVLTAWTAVLLLRCRREYRTRPA